MHNFLSDPKVAEHYLWLLPAAIHFVENSSGENNGENQALI
jgi:hypothetical protein